MFADGRMLGRDGHLLFAVKAAALVTIFLLIPRADGAPAPLVEEDFVWSCLPEAERGTADRSGTVVRLLVRNWMSHELVSSLAAIILTEKFGYTVKFVAAPSNYFGQLDQLVEHGLMDADLESWSHYIEIKGTDLYNPAACTPATSSLCKANDLVDVVSNGYGGRSGIYLLNATASKSRLIDYYKPFQQPTWRAEMGIESCSSSRLKANTGSSFPVCDPAKHSWCNTDGQWRGFYAPTLCFDDQYYPPEDRKCSEVIMGPPSWDTGFFETLSRTLGLYTAFAYHDASTLSRLRLAMETANPQKDVLFYSFRPNWGAEDRNAWRISFPDIFPGCDKNVGDPRLGKVDCDYKEKRLKKLIAKSLKVRAPAAYFFLKAFRLSKPDDSNLLKLVPTPTASSSQMRTAACSFLKIHPDHFPLKSCAVNPKSSPQPGELVQDSESGACVPMPAKHTHSCFGATRPGTQNRSKTTIKLAKRNWLTHHLTRNIMAILLEEYLGYSVEHADVSSSSTMDWGPDIEARKYDVEPENWRASDPVDIDTWAEDRAVVLTPHVIGYTGREGIYTFPFAVKNNPNVDYYRYFQGSFARLEGFRQPNQARYTQLMGSNTAIAAATLGKEHTERAPYNGHYYPPICIAQPSECIEVIMPTTSWASGVWEQMLRNTNMNAVLTFYGDHWKTLPLKLQSATEKTLFYAFTPDPMLARLGILQTGLGRISFVDFQTRCDSSNYSHPEAPTASRICDMKITVLKTVIAKFLDLPMARPSHQAVYMLQRLSISQTAIEGMLGQHPDGGGSDESTAESIACAWVKANANYLKRTAVKDCIARPVEKPAINTEAWDPELKDCVLLTCSADSILTHEFGGNKCHSCHEGVGPDSGTVPNEMQTECIPCDPGKAPDVNRSRCIACPNGTHAVELGSVECTKCPAGRHDHDMNSTTECKICVPGSIQGLEGQTTCELCSPGQYSSKMGETQCTMCQELHAEITGGNDEKNCSRTEGAPCFAYYAANYGHTTCPRCPRKNDVEVAVCIPNANDSLDMYYAAKKYYLLPLLGEESNDTSSEFPLGQIFACPHRQGVACEGHNRCAEDEESGLVASHGPLCGVCSEGFVRAFATDVCKKCGKSADLLFWSACNVGLVFMVSTGILIMTLMHDQTCPKSVSSVIFKQVVNYAAMLSVVMRVTSEVKSFDVGGSAGSSQKNMNIVDSMLGAQPPTVTAAATACLMKAVVGDNLEVSYAFVIIGILWIPLWAGFLYLVFGIINCFRIIFRKQALGPEVFITSLVVNVFVIHPRVTQLFLTSFQCETFDSYRFLMNTEIECFDSNHVFWQICSIIGILVFSFGTPVIAYKTLTYYSTQGRLRELKVVKMLGFLYNGFEERTYYFEAIYMARKVLYQIAVLLPISSRQASDEILIQTASLLILASGFLALHMKYQPYDNREYFILDRIEASSLWAILITLLVSLWTQVTENASIFSHASSDKPKEIRNLLSVLILVGVHFRFFAFVIYGLLQPWLIRCFQRSSLKQLLPATITVEEDGLKFDNLTGVDKELFLATMGDIVNRHMGSVRNKREMDGMEYVTFSYSGFITSLRVLCLDAYYSEIHSRAMHSTEAMQLKTEALWGSVSSRPVPKLVQGVSESVDRARTTHRTNSGRLVHQVTHVEKSLIKKRHDFFHGHMHRHHEAEPVEKRGPQLIKDSRVPRDLCPELYNLEQFRKSVNTKISVCELQVAVIKLGEDLVSEKPMPHKAPSAKEEQEKDERERRGSLSVHEEYGKKALSVGALKNLLDADPTLSEELFADDEEGRVGMLSDNDSNAAEIAQDVHELQHEAGRAGYHEAVLQVMREVLFLADQDEQRKIVQQLAEEEGCSVRRTPRGITEILD